MLLLFIGRDRSRRAGTVADDVPSRDHRRGMSAWRRRLPWAIWTVVLIAFSMGSGSPMGLAAAPTTTTRPSSRRASSMAIIFLSFVVVTGMGGQVSLMQASFVTAGGFAAGWALTWHWPDIPVISPGGHVNLLLAVVIGAIVAAIVGALIALPLTRLGGVSLALGTLAWAFFLARHLPAANNRQRRERVGDPGTDARCPGPQLVDDFLIRDKQNFFDSSQLPNRSCCSWSCSA